VPRPRKSPLGYDRAGVLFGAYTGWELHQLRHFATTHLGEKNVPLQTIMAKTRHRNPRTAMRYIRPSAETVTHSTEELLDPADTTR
jgi:integrase